MNNKELVELARSVGIRFEPAGPDDDGIDTWFGEQYLPSGALRAFFEAACSLERERCLLVVRECCGDSVIEAHITAEIQRPTPNV